MLQVWISRRLVGCAISGLPSAYPSGGSQGGCLLHAGGQEPLPKKQKQKWTTHPPTQTHYTRIDSEIEQRIHEHKGLLQYFKKKKNKKKTKKQNKQTKNQLMQTITHINTPDSCSYKIRAMKSYLPAGNEHKGLLRHFDAHSHKHNRIITKQTHAYAAMHIYLLARSSSASTSTRAFWGTSRNRVRRTHTSINTKQSHEYAAMHIYLLARSSSASTSTRAFCGTSRNRVRRNVSASVEKPFTRETKIIIMSGYGSKYAHKVWVTRYNKPTSKRGKGADTFSWEKKAIHLLLHAHTPLTLLCLYLLRLSATESIHPPHSFTRTYART